MKIVIATNNAHKIEEVKEILAPEGIEVLSMKEAGIHPEEPEENGTTFYENALIKAKSAAALTDLPVIADDSGIEIEALGNKPGIYSARFADSFGGYPGTFDYLLAFLKDKKDRRARFVCDIVLLNLGDKPLCFEGKIEGSIAREPSGNGGFGYDPIFIPEGMNVTTADISPEEKNRISHRGRALAKLADYLNDAGCLD